MNTDQVFGLTMVFVLMAWVVSNLNNSKLEKVSAKNQESFDHLSDPERTENYNKIDEFCSPESLTYCASPDPYTYDIDPVVKNVPLRFWNPSLIKSVGASGAAPFPIPRIATPGD